VALSIQVDDIAQKAATFRPSRAILTILALPFFVIGFVAAIIWVALSWCFAAVAVGFSDAKVRAGRRSGDG